MTTPERREIDGHVVDDRAFHPMTFAGTCLRCGRSDLAEGCEPKNRRERTDALVRRGLSIAVAEDLRYGTYSTPWVDEFMTRKEAEVAAKEHRAFIRHYWAPNCPTCGQRVMTDPTTRAAHTTEPEEK